MYILLCGALCRAGRGVLSQKGRHDGCSVRRGTVGKTCGSQQKRLRLHSRRFWRFPTYENKRQSMAAGRYRAADRCVCLHRLFWRGGKIRRCDHHLHQGCKGYPLWCGYQGRRQRHLCALGWLRCHGRAAGCRPSGHREPSGRPERDRLRAVCGQQLRQPDLGVPVAVRRDGF